MEILASYGPYGPLQTYISLIHRSHCVLDKVILIGAAHDTNNADLDSFLQLLPFVQTLNMNTLMPASIIQKIQNGLLPLLWDISWTIDLEGFGAILDLVDLYIA